jgi:5-methylcytosine-specific restriction enzyme subunit McrC
MIPFIVDMARLYESFVYEWLDQHLPSQYSVKDQEQVGIGDSKRAFDVDLVFYSGSDAIAVADTKYKTPSQPSTEDISQVISYAEARGVEKAFLVYPETLDNPIETTVGDVQVESLTFGIEGDLDDEGELFVSEFERAVMGGIGLPSA